MMTMMMMRMTTMMMTTKQASARRAEKALQEILHKADHDSNGRVRFSPQLETVLPTKIFLTFLTNRSRTMSIYVPLKALKEEQFSCQVKLKDYLEILDVNDIKVGSNRLL